MKRWIVQLTAFAVTFFLGSAFITLVVWFWTPICLYKGSEESAQSSSEQLVSECDLGVPTEEYVEPAIEFYDLPNLRDYSFNESSKKLIDVQNTGGTYRASEIVAKNGEFWLTLFERDGQYSLIKSKVAVRSLKSVSYPGDETNAKIGFDVSGMPILATRNLKALKPGPIVTFYHRPNSNDFIEPMRAGFRLQMKSADETYVLRVSNGLTKGGDKVAVLVLEQGNNSQIVAYNYEMIGDLLWAGDLDGDGKPDLYFNESNEKGYFESQLFLSSEAPHDKLVKLAATFGMLGC